MVLRRVPAWFAWLAALGCAGAPPAHVGSAGAAGPASAVSAVGDRGTSGRAVDAGSSGAGQEPDTDPKILLPAGDSADEAVATVESFSIHKRHVFDRLAEDDPGRVRAVIRQMSIDVLVAEIARCYSITVEKSAVDRIVTGQEKELRQRVAKLGPSVTFDGFLRRNFNLSEEEYRRWSRTKTTRELYREYVLRYVSMREDRVVVRYIAHSDPEVLEEVAAKVRQGADFATLAIHHSEDPNRDRGGALPPFGRGYDHPVADVAFELGIGELSEVFARESGGGKKYYLVYCRDKLPGRDVAFADVRDEIERKIDLEPLTAPEWEAAADLLEARFEALKRSAPLR